ncbi:Hypothetical protein NTJ_15435 [Nesidiocoris tenuis]|uniref:Uncharacterized protein n=1 Tax=Nesidiocoris tenuis TaxID=355587 RepID=A0ABN7BHA8_9HEMI|nr:Hypothetical protein NTJ_15435 [Nesidiocoris tenuis]
MPNLSRSPFFCLGPPFLARGILSLKATLDNPDVRRFRLVVRPRDDNIPPRGSSRFPCRRFRDVYTSL